jgi:photosystem II stability/assembly factor-like uncharacterized protein
MKRITILAAALLTWNFSSAQLWDTVNVHADNTLNSLYFTGPDTGVVVGYNNNGGSISLTTDGGASWNGGVLPAGIEKLNDVHFINPTTGFAVGDSGNILKTTDYGFNWAALPDSIHLFF